MSVNHESLLTHDEFALALPLAQERYMTMLSEVDYSAADLEDPEVKTREAWLAMAAWRQAVTFVMTRRQLAEDQIQG